jgi:6-pyruvoyl-tetrahydropterin synthase
MDFHALERLVDEVIGPMHNRHLNELEPFAPSSSPSLNPSAENVALHVARSLRLPAARGLRLVRVDVAETPENFATYRA